MDKDEVVYVPNGIEAMMNSNDSCNVLLCVMYCRPLTMSGVCCVPRPCVCVSVCVSVCVLLSLCVGQGAEALISKHCDTYEEDVYVQPDKVKTLSCDQQPGLGPYTECSSVTDFRWVQVALRLFEG